MQVHDHGARIAAAVEQLVHRRERLHRPLQRADGERGAAREHERARRARRKSGGRVVKNVTGYDLCKVLAGSWGTLAAMTDVTVKVLPRAETEETLLVLGLDDATAAKAMSAAMGSSNDVSGAAHFPAPLARERAQAAPGAVTALRLEGVAPSVAHRVACARKRCSSHSARSAALRRPCGVAHSERWRAT